MQRTLQQDLNSLQELGENLDDGIPRQMPTPVHHNQAENHPSTIHNQKLTQVEQAKQVFGSKTAWKAQLVSPHS